MKEIILIGSFQPCDSLSRFCVETQRDLDIHIRLLHYIIDCIMFALHIYHYTVHVYFIINVFNEDSSLNISVSLYLNPSSLFNNHNHQYHDHNHQITTITTTTTTTSTTITTTTTTMTTTTTTTMTTTTTTTTPITTTPTTTPTYRYLQEFTALGTAGGMYHFRDQILSGKPRQLFVMNCDACGEFPLAEMLRFHQSKPSPAFTILGTEVIHCTDFSRERYNTHAKPCDFVHKTCTAPPI